MFRTTPSPRRLSETQSLAMIIASLVIVLLTTTLHLGPAPAELLAPAAGGAGTVTGSIR